MSPWFARQVQNWRSDCVGHDLQPLHVYESKSHIGRWKKNEAIYSLHIRCSDTLKRKPCKLKSNENNITQGYIWIILAQRN